MASITITITILRVFNNNKPPTNKITIGPNVHRVPVERRLRRKVCEAVVVLRRHYEVSAQVQEK
jgi:hypothetical protein